MVRLIVVGLTCEIVHRRSHLLGVTMLAANLAEMHGLLRALLHRVALPPVRLIIAVAPAAGGPGRRRTAISVASRGRHGSAQDCGYIICRAARVVLAGRACNLVR